MKKALVFLNMGAPRNLDEVEVFLRNMFTDKNIITVKSNLLRSIIASSIIATRKNEAKGNYAQLGGKSPLVDHTQTFLNNVKKAFPEYEVVNIMRYTPSFALSEIKWLKAKGVEELTVIPLYAQYSTTTTKSSLEDLYEAMAKANFTPNMKIISRFYHNETYNKAIIAQIKEALDDKNPEELDLIFSAHSLPVKIIKAGDTYQKEVIENVEILTKMLQKEELNFKNIHLAYQSKLGPVQWLEPSLENKLKSIDNKKVLIYPISFILDNSETEFELDIEYKEVAEELGLEEYIVAKCLNENPLFIKAVKELVLT
ncbi:MAG: ferrochelatase [Epsilonproteobacteria bacterium]|nr:ferrochelatase [Campylobacterota bacterium]